MCAFARLGGSWSRAAPAHPLLADGTTFTGLKLQGDIGKFGQVELSDIEGFCELPDGKVLSARLGQPAAVGGQPYQV